MTPFAISTSVTVSIRLLALSLYPLIFIVKKGQLGIQKSVTVSNRLVTVTDVNLTHMVCIRKAKKLFLSESATWFVHPPSPGSAPISHFTTTSLRWIFPGIWGRASTWCSPTRPSSRRSASRKRQSHSSSWPRTRSCSVQASYCLIRWRARPIL